MPLFGGLNKKRRQVQQQLAEQQPQATSNRLKVAVEEPPPLEGFDQTVHRHVACFPRDRHPIFAKSLDDVFNSPRLLSSFLEHLDKSSRHYAQFVIDVQAFKASYTLASQDHSLATTASPQDVPTKRAGTEGFSGIFNPATSDSVAATRGVSTSDSIDSFDSGIASPGSVRLPPKKQPQNNSSPTSSTNSIKLSEEAAKAIQVMAIGIYQSYIFPDSPSELKILPRPIVQSVIEGICIEPGTDNQVPLGCFDTASKYIKGHLTNNVLQTFFDSSAYAKYQLEVLRPVSPAHDEVDSQSVRPAASEVRVQDIFGHEKLSSHFMEFMEVSGKSGRRLLEFWLNVDMIHSASTADCSNQQKDCKLTQSDAMLIYEKFVSMQAPTPLGLSNEIRCNIEEKICSGSNFVSSDCFEAALSVVVAALNAKFLPSFLTSTIFQQYLTELEKSATLQPRSPSKTMTPLRKRAGSTSSLTTTVSSETSGGLISNTLLATSSASRSSTRRSGPGGRKSSHTNFLDFYNSDPSHLFKRKHYRLTNIGHVNHLGRYTSCVSWPVEDKAGSKANKKQSVTSGGGGGGVPMSRKLTTAMKRLVVSETEEQYREEMSWQMAELIITEVKKIKLGKPNL